MLPRIVAVVSSVDLVAFDHAARALGITKAALLRRLDSGGLPEAIQRNGVWSVPSAALPDIAEREGWPLDLTDDRTPSELPALPDQLDRYLNETMAAHAAVVLAKTQAAAARAEARDLAVRVEQLTAELDGAHRELADVGARLIDSERAQAILERDRAVAEARVEEIRGQVEQERLERAVLSNRLTELEADYESALSSMGWLSRRRYDSRQL